MLRVTRRWLAVMRKLVPVMAEIAKADGGLGDQVRRAAASVALNQAEGYGSHKGNRLARWKTAFGSLRETQMALEVAVALGYIAPLEGELADELDRVAAESWLLMHPRR